MKLKAKISKEELKEMKKPKLDNRGNVNIPLIYNISPEVESKLNKEYEEANTYEALKQKKIDDKYNKHPSKLNDTAKYLWKNLFEKVELETKEICKDLKISRHTLHTHIADLNFYDKFPLTIIHMTNKKGWITSITSDYGEYMKWKKKKQRTITTMSVVLDKGTLQGDNKFIKEERQKQVMTIKDRGSNEQRS